MLGQSITIKWVFFYGTRRGKGWKYSYCNLLVWLLLWFLTRVFVSKWLHTPKASHSFTITQHISRNGMTETSSYVLCYFQDEHSSFPSGIVNDIQLTLPHHHCKMDNSKHIMIATLYHLPSEHNGWFAINIRIDWQIISVRYINVKFHFWLVSNYFQNEIWNS